MSDTEAIDFLLDHFFIYDEERDSYFIGRREYHERYKPLVDEAIRTATERGGGDA